MDSSPGPDHKVSPHPTLLVCHAGETLGIGHLTRTLAVVAALRVAGTDNARVLIQGEPFERTDLAGVDHSFVDLESDLFDAVLAAYDEVRPAVVVFDLHPHLIPDDFADRAASLRDRGVRLVGVDSALDLCTSFDLTWVPSLLVDNATLGRCPADLQWGWDSFLITRRLPVEAWSPGTRVLVLTGGSDVTNQGETLPALLDGHLPARSEISWVRGPFASEPILPAEPRHSWTVHDAPTGLDELIHGADYAVTVFGVTLFELLQYGTPTVVFSPYEDREFSELAVVAEAGVAAVTADASSAVSELVSLMGDPDRAGRLSRSALERMGVNGADRLAGLIHSLTE